MTPAGPAERVGTPGPILGRLPQGMAATTAAKVLATVAIRIPYVFLGTIARGLDTSIARLGALFGLAELVGLATFLIGRSIDRGAYRLWLLAGLASVVSGLAVMAFATAAPLFAFGFAGVTLGIAVYTAAGHSWIGHEVPFARRGQIIGLFEMSWAVAFLLGAPLVGLLIAATTWRTPWWVIAAGLVPVTLWLSRSFPASHVHAVTARAAPRLRLNRTITLTLASVFLASFGATAIFSTFGAWLQDRFGLPVRTIGLLSIAIGGAELLASSSAARFSDQWGKVRSGVGGITLMTAGALAVAVVPKVPVLGVAALVMVFLGFEFGFICVLSIVSEVGGENRGTVVSVNGALMTLARASSAALGTTIYAGHGMPASAGLTICCCTAAMACLLLSSGGTSGGTVGPRSLQG